MNLFFIIAIMVLSIIHGTVGLRIIPFLNMQDSLKIVTWFFIALLAALPIIPIILRSKGFENETIDWFSWVGYISLGFFMLTFMAVITKDLIYLVIGLLTKITTGLGYPNGPNDPSRRDFIQKMLSIGIITTAGAATIAGLYGARKGATIMETTVPIKGLGKDLNGMTIAQISDMHVGPTIKKNYVEEVVEQVNRLNPDIIAVTGDLVDGSVEHLSKHIEPIKDLDAKIGKYFVTGNHEYYSGVDQWLEKIDHFGLTNLVDSHEIITKGNDSLTLGGVTDFRSSSIKPDHKSDPATAFAGSPDGVPKILLAHQPWSIFGATKAGADLQLSGHTHGGQFWPFVYAVRLANPYTAGLHNHDGTWIYVNRGTGYWGPPMRLGVESEITLVRLETKKN